MPDEVQALLDGLGRHARPGIAKTWPPVGGDDAWTVALAVRQREGRRALRATWRPGEGWSLSLPDGTPSQAGLTTGAAVGVIAEALRRPAPSNDGVPPSTDRLREMLLSTATSIETAHRQGLPALDEEVAALLGWACIPTDGGEDAWQRDVGERPTEGPAPAFTRELFVVVERAIPPRTAWSISCGLDRNGHWARTARVGKSDGGAPTHARALIAAALRYRAARLE